MTTPPTDHVATSRTISPREVVGVRTEHLDDNQERQRSLCHSQRLAVSRLRHLAEMYLANKMACCNMAKPYRFIDSHGFQRTFDLKPFLCGPTTNHACTHTTHTDIHTRSDDNYKRGCISSTNYSLLKCDIVSHVFRIIDILLR